MSKMLKVTRREYLATVRTKGFIIGLLVAPVFMAGSGIVFALMEGRVDTADKQFAVIDRSGLMTEVITAAAEARNATVREEESNRRIPAYHIEIVPPDEADPDGQRFALSERVRSDDLHAYIEIGPGVLHPSGSERDRITYHAPNAAIDENRGWFNSVINNELRRLRLVEAGINTEQVPDLFTWISVVGMGLVSTDEATGTIGQAEQASELETILVPIVVMLLMFLMIMMAAVPQLQAVMEEKSNRIAEVILGSIRPFDFMMGKLLGGVAVALTAWTVYLTVALVVLRNVNLERFIPWHILPWFLLYVIVAIFMYGALMAALGAMCNDPSEAQNVTFPAMLPIMLPMFFLMPILQAPNTTFSIVFSLIPPFTPTLLLVWISGRVFRGAILMQGTPPKLKNFLRWATRG